MRSEDLEEVLNNAGLTARTWNAASKKRAEERAPSAIHDVTIGDSFQGISLPAMLGYYLRSTHGDHVLQLMLILYSHPGASPPHSKRAAAPHFHFTLEPPVHEFASCSILSALCE